MARPVLTRSGWWRWLALPLAASVTTLCSSSCIQIGPDPNADAGTDADAGATVEEQCTTIMTAYCARSVDCFGGDPDLCLETAVPYCCADYCDSPATSSKAALDACVTAFSQESCEDVNGAVQPKACRHVITH